MLQSTDQGGVCSGVRMMVLLAAVVVCVVGNSVWAITYVDPDYDVVFRRTDGGLIAPFDPESHRAIDLQRLVIGRWVAVDVVADPFDGEYSSGSGFMRLDVVVGGLVNPPGNTDSSSFHPFTYGDNPVYGYVEIDMDNDNDTGGEIEAPGDRYLANVARFGGLPEGDVFEDRLAIDGSADDENFETPPYIERHGEEFHLALLGYLFNSGDISEVSGDGDLLFEEDEVWDITARWFHRAHGFEPYSFVIGGPHAGEYSPICRLRFAHDSASATTTISLVFPITVAAGGEFLGQEPMPPNSDCSDQVSIAEALRDLRFSAAVVGDPTDDPEKAIILGWKNRNEGPFLNPVWWRMTAILGTSYEEKEYGYVWTDVYPNVVRGDVNGAQGANQEDIWAIDDYIGDHDIDDGIADGQVTLADFAEDFSVYDVNYDGVVDQLDKSLVSPVGDCNLDNVVDLADFAIWQTCNGLEVGLVSDPCSLADLDSDGDVDLGDFRWFRAMMTGPVVP